MGRKKKEFIKTGGRYENTKENEIVNFQIISYELKKRLTKLGYDNFISLDQDLGAIIKGPNNSWIKIDPVLKYDDNNKTELWYTLYVSHSHHSIIIDKGISVNNSISNLLDRLNW